MPAAISSLYNYQYTKYQGKIYNGYVVGIIWGRVLMCIPAKENYHITSLCLRPYDDIYLMLESTDVEVDDGSGSIAMMNDVYPFNCSQLEPRPEPVSRTTGRPMRTVTKVLKNQRTSCSVCFGAGKVYYQDGYKREYVNSTYQKVSASYGVSRCKYCRGTGYLWAPDVTIQVYESD